MTSVLDTELKEYKILDALIPNNWIRLLGAGSGGYFLICPKISSQETIDKLINFSFNKFLKAELSREGVTTQIF